jgi:hypothetical protein
MESKPRVAPFRWILPLLELFLSVVILWPMLPNLIGEIRVSLREYGVLHDSGATDPSAPRPRPFDLSDLSDPQVRRRIELSKARDWTVATLNLPGGLPDLTYSILSPAHSEWIPRGMFMWNWRDVSWPIIGIFFWWIAGRSIEAFLYSRQGILLPKLRWWEVVASIPAGAFGAIFAIIVGFDQSTRQEFPFWILPAVFCGMWIILGLFPSAMYIVQWRMRRRPASSSAEPTEMLTPAS